MPKGRAKFLILSLDLGSSSARSALFDKDARRIPKTEAVAHHTISYKADGAAELEPVILLRNVRRVLSQSVKAREQTPSLKRVPIKAISASAFWHGLLGVDRNWCPLTPIFTWADTRAGQDARVLREELSERTIHTRTGCMLHSSFWPAKLRWLRRTRPQLFDKVAQWVSPMDWIYQQLFGATASSVSMASATGLYNSAHRTWDEKLCSVCHINPRHLPIVSQTIEPTRLPFVSHSPVSVFTAIGDGAAGNLGSGADHGNIIAINVGTSAALRVIQSNRAVLKLPLGLFRYAVDERRQVVGGALSNAGNLRQWALRELRIKRGAASDRLVFERAAAACDPLIALPFWAGERAPTWPDDQRGVLHGVTQSTGAADLLRALTTSVFYRLADILERVASAGVKPRRIIVSGGILRSLPAVQLLADAIGHDVEVAREAEASLRGAAVYALQCLGMKVAAIRRGSLIKHDRKLSASHLNRRHRQQELEKALTASDL